MTGERRELFGRLMAVSAACGFATMGVFSVFFYEHGGEPTSLLFLRFAGAAIVFWLVAAARRAWPYSRRFVVQALGLGAFQLGAGWGLLEGFAHAPASLVVLLFYIYPLVATVAAWKFLSEVLTARRVVLLGVGLAGIALAVGVPGSAPAVGIGLGLLAGVCLGLTVVGSRHLLVTHGVGPFDLLPFMWLGPTVFLAIIAGTRSLDFPSDAAGWWHAAGLVLLATVVPSLVFYTALRMIPASTAAMLGTPEPFVAVLLAFAVLGESLTGMQLAGGAMIVSAVFLISIPARRREPVPSPEVTSGLTGRLGQARLVLRPRRRRSR